MDRRSRAWTSPEPRCLFVVACTAELPSIVDLLDQESSGDLQAVASRVGSNKDQPLETPMGIGDGFGLITPERGLVSVAVADRPPNLPIMSNPAEWEQVGLTEELARRFKDAPHAVLINMNDPGQSSLATVLFATRFADRLSKIGKGCVDDFTAHRFFAEGSWESENPVEGFDAPSHLSLHVQPSAPRGLWIHTHGLSKFGRAELEMRAVPEELLERAVQTIFNCAAYVVEEKEILPGHTLGNPDTPLYVRISTSNVEHWEGAAALELVDVDRTKNPVPIGVERGLKAMIWA